MRNTWLWRNDLGLSGPTYQENEERTGDRSVPGAHINENLHTHLVSRAAYARRPNRVQRVVLRWMVYPD